jgi:hypothetical protein
MLFIHPMWDSECERIGKRKCTPVGYALHWISEMIGFLGFLLLLVTLAFFGYKWAVGAFRTPLLWLLAAPLGMGILSEILFRYSWWLASRKSFAYDCEHGQASWLEAGERRSYAYNHQT